MKVIAFCLSGIGNTILFTPTLRALRKNYPEAELTLLVAKRVFGEPVEGSGIVDDIIVFGGQSVFGKLRLLWRLRKVRYDHSITAFPSNKWQHNLFAFLVGARTRITHGYRVARWRTLSFLQSEKVPAIEGVHDVEQNLRLLQGLGVAQPNGGIEKQPFFHVPQEAQRFATDFWQRNGLCGQFVVGIHPGCDRKNAYKRWPKQSFVDLMQRLIDKKNTHILLFAGPDEGQLADSMCKALTHGGRVHAVKKTPLQRVGALIARCDCFVCNDSALGHTAATVGVKTLAILGPTVHTRTAPYGPHGNFVRTGISCSPCLAYPLWTTTNKIVCRREFECLTGISPEMVCERLTALVGCEHASVPPDRSQEDYQR